MCSTGADIKRTDCRSPSSARTEPKKTKRGLRYFPPNQPTIWHIGYKLGEALRAAEEKAERQSLGGTHATPFPTSDGLTGIHSGKGREIFL
ncbi:MAG: hypothetical protein P4L38_11690 [Syntrophaceae bacterium]|nr:hypothetical protein [Syntrophaceae bacterium]